MSHRRTRTYRGRAGLPAAIAALAPAVGLALAYFGFSLFDPWNRLPPIVHGLVFVCLIVALVSGVIAAIRAGRRGWARTEVKWGRYALLLPLLAVGLYVAGPDLERRLVLSLQPGYFFAPPPMTLAAEIVPPDYTGVAPIALALDADPVQTVTVPVGSMLRVTARDTRWPPYLAWGREAVPFRPADDPQDGYVIEGELKADGNVKVSYNGRAIARWHVQVSPDAKPTVRLAAPPGITARNSLRLAIEARDDYGVSHMMLRLRRADGTGQEHLVELPAYGTREFDNVIYHSLLSHPLAGEEVALSVIAVDGRYQEAETATHVVTLPRRSFTNPTALSLNAARSGLLSGTREEVERATRRLGGLSENAAGGDVTVQLGLRTAYLRLKNAKSRADHEAIADLLWDLALRAEDGDLTQTEITLHDSLERLTFALYREDDEALQPLIRDLARAFEAYGRARAGGSRPRKMQDIGNGPVDDGLDWAAVKRFILRLDEMAAAGHREEILDQINDLRAGLEERPDLLLSAGAYRRYVIASYARRLVDEVVREQRLLLSIAVGPSLDNGGFSDKLAAAGRQKLISNQSALRDALKSLIGQLDRAGMTDMEALHRAQEAMDEVMRSIEAGSPDNVASAQVQAITALDLAAKALATIPSPLPVDEEGRPRDPLGRPLPPLDDMPASAIERAIRGSRP